MLTAWLDESDCVAVKINHSDLYCVTMQLILKETLILTDFNVKQVFCLPIRIWLDISCYIIGWLTIRGWSSLDVLQLPSTRRYGNDQKAKDYIKIEEGPCNT